MKIAVFGTGYVGLVQGAVLAEVGHDVLCVDVDAKKVEGLKAGEHPDLRARPRGAGEEEPRRGAAELHHRRRGRGARTAASSSSPSARPPDEDGSADLYYVLAVAGTIAEHMEEPKVVVTKSTVPVGTADKVRAKLVEALGKARPRRTSASTWSRTPSSSRRAPRSPTACAPTASSSAPGHGDPRSCCARSTPRSAATTTSSSSWTCARPSSPSTRRTACSRPRSAS